MNDEGGFRRLGVSRADQARPPRLDVVLSVADIEEAELLGLVADRVSVLPSLCVVFTVPGAGRHRADRDRRWSAGLPAPQLGRAGSAALRGHRSEVPLAHDGLLRRDAPERD